MKKLTVQLRFKLENGVYKPTDSLTSTWLKDFINGTVSNEHLTIEEYQYILSIADEKGYVLTLEDGTKKFIVRRMQDLAKCDTFDAQKADFGFTHRKLGKWEFDTLEAALKFYEERILASRFAGLAGEYYTYPAEK